MPLLNIPYYIVIHHSATPDHVLFSNFEAIRTYHKSYAIDGHIVDEDAFYDRMSMHDGEYFKKPWKDIGYHYVIEYVDEMVVIRDGRVEDEYGAHEYRKMLNRFGKLVSINFQSIGICLVGDYDKSEPLEDMYSTLESLVSKLIKKYSIPVSNILGHREIDGVHKTCPGKKIDMDLFRHRFSTV